MDQSGLSAKDLESIIGKSNRVYEVLGRKRPLTLAMIRRLHKSLGIPADVLIAETAAPLGKVCLACPASTILSCQRQLS
jgi:HTH-type transcriptional regulator/antitoxin HigA